MLRRSLNDEMNEPVDESVFVFPSETDLERPKNIGRVSKQHSFPPVEPLLRQIGFTTYFKPQIFESLFDKPIVIKKNTAGCADQWTEPKSKFETRRSTFRAALAKTDDTLRRAATVTAVNECYLKLVNMHCSSSCEVESRKSKGIIGDKNSCIRCKSIRSALKKHYIQTLTDAVCGVVNDLFSKREHPFSKCPKAVTGTRYVDEFCRVERIREAEKNSI